MKPRAVPFAVAAEKRGRLRAILRLDRVEFFADDFICFFPTDRLEFALAALSNAAQRRADAVGTLNVLPVVDALRTDFPAVVRMVRRALHL